MEFNREGTSITKPPLLYGTNYAYWEVMMIAFYGYRWWGLGHIRRMLYHTYSCCGLADLQLLWIGIHLLNAKPNGLGRKNKPLTARIRQLIPSIIELPSQSFVEDLLALRLRLLGTSCKPHMKAHIQLNKLSSKIWLLPLKLWGWKKTDQRL